ncbi:PREDICTED: zinc transporter 11-like isoform X2 [Nelumbo nucifera]|uniref:Zinc transporter 11-like isoform X2 n=1 Tax=Nelumbo nucifera TaxID=4432 RepID=A0A1U8AQS4_NELNU|nr:PREDICTED: zinc transporter 11-like isoform X2 [Nelumbo nucifera]
MGRPLARRKRPPGFRKQETVVLSASAWCGVFPLFSFYDSLLSLVSLYSFVGFVHINIRSRQYKEEAFNPIRTYYLFVEFRPLLLSPPISICTSDTHTPPPCSSSSVYTPMPAEPSLLLLFLVLVISAHGHGDDAVPSPSSTDEPDLRSKSLIIVKVCSLFLVFIGTFLAGLSPCLLKWNERFLVLGIQFAGGVFLGTALMHFLSDSTDTFKDLTTKEYPFAFMLASVGYLLTMFADCVISHVYNKQGNEVWGDDVEPLGAEPQPSSRKYTGTSSSSSHGTTSQSQFQVVDNRRDDHLDFVETSLATVRSLGDSILLIVALCFHSVFEGIAIGVAETKANAWRAVWTVSLHKIFAAVGMGIALLRMIPDRPLSSCIAYAFAFAISSPSGVVIGIVIDSTTRGVVADWIYAVSMGLASGVFIYVCVNHLLSKGYTYTPQSQSQRDRHRQGESSFCNFLAVLSGVGVIAVVMIWDTY